MVSDGNVLQLTLQSTFGSGGNTGLNVFQYRVDTEADFDLIHYGESLLNQWYVDVTEALQPVTSSQVAWYTVSMVNLSNPLEIYSGSPDTIVGGSNVGEALPPYASWGFKLVRGTGLTRNGAKRFWGVPEAFQVNGIPAGAAITALPVLGDFLSAELPFTLVGSPDVDMALIPVIVRKNAAGVLVDHQDIIDGQFRSLTTQNSRKFGRGM